MAIDPVCGMTVDEQKAPATAVHEGTTYLARLMKQMRVE